MSNIRIGRQLLRVMHGGASTAAPRVRYPHSRAARRDAGLPAGQGLAKSITDLAEQEGVTDAYVCRLLPLTCLAPDIAEAILDGRQPKGTRLAEMLGRAACLGHSAGELRLQQLT